MKNIVLLILLFPTLLFAQGDNIKGKWILDYVTYENGNPLEIEHPLFSTFKSLEINDKYIIIDKINKIKAQTYVGRIATRYIKYKYHIDNKYLVLKEDKDDKLFYYLRILDFKKKYPDTKSQYVEYEGKKVLKYNELLNIDILNRYNFDSISKFHKNIKSYKKHLFANKMLKATFILTADNKIENVKIEKSISRKFDEDFIEASHNLTMLYTNNTGNDVLMEHYDYLGKYFIKRNDLQKEFFANKLIADYYFTNKQFQLSKEIYSMLYNSKDILDPVDSGVANEIYKKLYISLLHTNNLLEACIMLNDIKESNYFDVKNYIKEYCPQ